MSRFYFKMKCKSYSSNWIKFETVEIILKCVIINYLQTICHKVAWRKLNFPLKLSKICSKTIFLVSNSRILILHLIVYYVPRRIMRVITRRATMLAGDWSRGAISPARILSESRNYPNCVHWHIFYFMWLRCVYVFLCVHSNLI